MALRDEREYPRTAPGPRSGDVLALLWLQNGRARVVGPGVNARAASHRSGDHRDAPSRTPGCGLDGLRPAGLRQGDTPLRGSLDIESHPWRYRWRNRAVD